MNIRLLLITLLCFLLPPKHFGQAPNLGSTASFAFFTAVGAFTNTGATRITGDIGTNSGALTGFPPGIIIGQTHIANATSNQAAIDVNAAYTALTGLTCGTSIGTALGNNQTLTPNIYCLGAASTLTGNLILDAQGDPNALFIFKIDGALTTNIASNIILTNSASFSNIYWQITGAVVLGENSIFKGTILCDAAISLLESATLTGRAFTRAGEISLHNNNSLIVLSLDLKYFSGKNQDNGVRLNWATASDSRNAQIELQKSSNARDFETIATFKNTNTNDAHTYSFLDNTPFEGTDKALLMSVYYRLKYVDINYVFDYSKVISVEKQTIDKAFIYPNPSTHHITIKNMPDAQPFTITDVIGKIQMKGLLNALDVLDISKLPTGYYTLNTQSIRMRFLKN